MRIFLLLFLFISNMTLASVTIPFSEISLKERFEQNDVNLDDKNFWRAKEIFSRLEEFGIELNDKGRCRYLTRKKLLQYGTQADWDCFFAFRNIVREIRYCAPDHWNAEIDGQIKMTRLISLCWSCAPSV